MARRTGLIEDFADLGKYLPWQVTLVAAAVLFVVLHLLAAKPVPSATDVAQLGYVVTGQLRVTIAGLAQYILPPALLLGAAMSFIERRRGRVLLSRSTRDPDDAIASMSWQDFERLLAAAFERRGFSVTRTGGAGADGGVDLVLSQGSEITLVQCKQWRARSVGVSVVRELYGAMTARVASNGIVVSAGSFTEDARAFARGRNMELLDGNAVAAMIRGAQSARGQAPPTNASGSPLCPKCGSPMVNRIARRGSNASNAFWGCPDYPRCRGTRPGGRVSADYSI